MPFPHIDRLLRLNVFCPEINATHFVYSSSLCGQYYLTGNIKVLLRVAAI